MKPTFVAALLQACLLTGLSVANPPSPVAPIPKPGLTYLYTVNISAGATVVIGPGPRGTRYVTPITGGAFSGPNLSGTVLPLGGDWSLADANHPNGSLTIDTRQTFATNDGAFIQIFETGYTETDGTAHVQLTYETGSPKYYWLNTVQGVGIIRPWGTSGLTVQAWQLNTS